MKNRIVYSLAPALVVLALSGCATPGSRIEKNPEMFAGLPEEVKGAVRDGQVEVGYPADAVYLALGKPDRRYARETAEGSALVLSWVSHDYYTDRQRVSARFKIRDSDGRLRSAQDDVWVDVKQSREYESKRVEIRDGVVTAIEEITR